MALENNTFKIMGSKLRLFVWINFISISVFFDLLLLRILLDNWGNQFYFLLVIIIPLSFVLLLALFHLIRLLKFVITSKPMLEFDGELLTELFYHDLKIPIWSIKKIEIRNQVGAFSPPVELLIKTHSNENGEPYVSNAFNLLSFRSKENELLITPIFYQGNRRNRINNLCNDLKVANPKIKVQHLGTWD